MNNATQENDLCEALAIVRASLGIKDGGNADTWLDCIAETQWEANAGKDRFQLLCDYVEHERMQAETPYGEELRRNGKPIADCDCC